MRILWLCNIVLPQIKKEFGFKSGYGGGWMQYMLDALRCNSNIQFGVCCPIFDKNRMKDGNADGIDFFSFHYSDGNVLLDEMVDRFEKILDKFKPDLIHIWGTEYVHSYALIIACERKGLLGKIVLDIQGIVSKCAILMGMGVDNEDAYISYQREFKNKIHNEQLVLQKVKHVIGRTDWIKACVLQVNFSVHYYSCQRIQNDIFYLKSATWSYSKCEKYSIFVSQGNYPIKGLHYVIKALPIIVREFPNTHVYCAGQLREDEYGQYIKSLIIKMKLESFISFVGVLEPEQMAVKYQSANVFLASSLVDSCPNSICEAMMIGTPVVSSYVGGVPDLICHGKSGFMYPLNEEYMMAYYVCEILRNPCLADKVSKEAVRSALERADKSVITKSMLHIYESISREEISTI